MASPDLADLERNHVLVCRKQSGVMESRYAIKKTEAEQVHVKESEGRATGEPERELLQGSSPTYRIGCE